MAKGKKPIEQYDHKGKKRTNNPPVGLVTPETDRETGKKNYSYDPHLDPQLVWAVKRSSKSKTSSYSQLVLAFDPQIQQNDEMFDVST